MPLSATTVGNLLASAIASSITNLSSSTTSASSSPSQAASPSPAPAPESASIPKGLNLPLLQFLNLNFPNLRIESIKDILQVNAILATTLQLHEQHKASAALQTLLFFFFTCGCHTTTSRGKTKTHCLSSRATHYSQAATGPSHDII